MIHQPLHRPAPPCTRGLDHQPVVIRKGTFLSNLQLAQSQLGRGCGPLDVCTVLMVSHGTSTMVYVYSTTSPGIEIIRSRAFIHSINGYHWVGFSWHWHPVCCGGQSFDRPQEGTAYRSLQLSFHAQLSFLEMDCGDMWRL